MTNETFRDHFGKLFLDLKIFHRRITYRFNVEFEHQIWRYRVS